MPPEYGEYFLISPHPKSSDTSDVLVGHLFKFRKCAYSVAGEGEDRGVAEDG